MTARTEIATRVCECCGAEFERRRFPNGRLEQLARFVDRRFCSRACFRKAAADGYRLRPPGVWETEPHQLNGAEAPSEKSDPRLAVSGRYPWDRKPAPRPAPDSGPFSAERQTNFPETYRED